MSSIKSFLDKIYRVLHLNNENVISVHSYKASIPSSELWCFPNGNYYEKNVIYWLDKIVGNKKDWVIFNVGANYGYYVLRYADVCKQFVAFEPVRKTFRILKKNVISNNLQNVRCIQKGISDINGSSQIFIYSSSLNNSIFKRNIPEGHSLKEIGAENIELVTLESCINNENLFLPDLIIMDTEGAELNVLKGAYDLIQKNMPIIIFEYSEATSQDAHYDRREIIKFLKKLGYKFYGLDSDPNSLDLIHEADFEIKNIGNVIALSANSTLP